ncbi:MAG: TIGR02221 family CRISPR-associated protein [Sulfurihydrogenibium sp.]
MGKTLLISFIGKATRNKNSQESGGKSIGYESVEYVFQDGTTYKTSFFPVAVYKYLIEKENKNPDIFIFGTTGSTWSELWQLVEEDEEIFSVASELENNSKDNNINNISGILKKFQDLLSNRLKSNLQLIPIEDEPPQVFRIAQEVYERLNQENYKEIILDITHSYRYMPFSVLSALMIYRNIKDFSIRIVYGFLEHKKNGKSPAYDLTDLSNLINLSNAISTFVNTGDFRKYYDIVGSEETVRHANELYYQIEINRHSRSLIDKVISFEPKEPFYKSIHKEVVKDIEEFSDNKLENRIANRAKFFAERGQYLKAIILLFEAIITLRCREMGRNFEDEKQREEVKKHLLKNDKDFNIFREVRNSVVHGTEVKIAKAKDILKSENRIKRFIDDIYKKYFNKK